MKLGHQLFPNVLQTSGLARKQSEARQKQSFQNIIQNRYFIRQTISPRKKKSIQSKQYASKKNDTQVSSSSIGKSEGVVLPYEKIFDFMTSQLEGSQQKLRDSKKQCQMLKDQLKDSQTKYEILQDVFFLLKIELATLKLQSSHHQKMGESKSEESEHLRKVIQESYCKKEENEKDEDGNLESSIKSLHRTLKKLKSQQIYLQTQIQASENEQESMTLQISLLQTIQSIEQTRQKIHALYEQIQSM